MLISLHQLLHCGRRNWGFSHSNDVSEEAKPEESKAVIDTEDVIPSTDSVAEVSPSTKSSNDKKLKYDDI